MALRSEGQIWLSRESPTTMKYYAQQKEYWLQSAATYIANVDIVKGTILAAATTAGKVRPAIFPKDCNNIVGIALSAALTNTLVRVVTYGYIDLTEAEAAAVFTTASDLNTNAACTGYYSAFGNKTSDGSGGNGFIDVFASNTYYGLGKPVYWFSGRTYKTGASTYAYADPSDHLGCLTLATPSGYKLNETEAPWSDESLQVSYKDLPIIGTIVDYTYDATGKITSLGIHINFSQFNKKIQFEWPSLGLKAYPDGTPSNPETYSIRHGLFTTYSANNPSIPHTELHAWGYSDANVDTSTAGECFGIHPGYDSFLTTDKRTEVEISSNSSFYYKITGEVSYNF